MLNEEQERKEYEEYNEQQAIRYEKLYEELRDKILSLLFTKKINAEAARELLGLNTDELVKLISQKILL